MARSCVVLVLVLASALYLTGVLAEDKTEVKVEDIHDSISQLIDLEKTNLREKREAKKKKKKLARRKKGGKVPRKKGRRKNNSAGGSKNKNTKKENLKRRKDRKNRIMKRGKGKSGK